MRDFCWIVAMRLRQRSSWISLCGLTIVLVALMSQSRTPINMEGTWRPLASIVDTTTVLCPFAAAFGAFAGGTIKRANVEEFLGRSRRFLFGTTLPEIVATWIVVMVPILVAYGVTFIRLYPSHPWGPIPGEALALTCGFVLLFATCAFAFGTMATKRFVPILAACFAYAFFLVMFFGIGGLYAGVKGLVPFEAGELVGSSPLKATNSQLLFWSLIWMSGAIFTVIVFAGMRLRGWSVVARIVVASLVVMTGAATWQTVTLAEAHYERRGPAAQSTLLTTELHCGEHGDIRVCLHPVSRRDPQEVAGAVALALAPVMDFPDVSHVYVDLRLAEGIRPAGSIPFDPDQPASAILGAVTGYSPQITALQMVVACWLELSAGSVCLADPLLSIEGAMLAAVRARGISGAGVPEPEAEKSIAEFMQRMDAATDALRSMDVEARTQWLTANWGAIRDGSLTLDDVGLAG